MLSAFIPLATIQSHPLFFNFNLALTSRSFVSAAKPITKSGLSLPMHIFFKISGFSINSTIGDLFPDTDPNYKDANSLDLLDEVVRRMTELNYTIGNIDCVIAAQKPKLAPHIPAMKDCLSNHLHTDIHNVSVKATTTEKLGFVGEEKGISAYATVLLKES